jgi:hypothetical protein
MLALAKPRASLDLVTDGHDAYVSAIESHPANRRIRHHRFPNPPGRRKGVPRTAEMRRRDAAMFPVDLLHKILRHTLAHHRRETIAFSRRLNAAMERLAVTAVWRNFVKGRSERRTHSGTPAMALNLTSRRWRWEEVLSRRLFFGREVLPEPWGQLYRREWKTPLLASNATHALSRAF